MKMNGDLSNWLRTRLAGIDERLSELKNRLLKGGDMNA